MDNETLAQALEAAGHADQARVIRDRALAAELRQAGHEGLAAQLEGNAAPAEAEPAKPKTAREAEAEAITAAIKRDIGRDFTPEAA